MFFFRRSKKPLKQDNLSSKPESIDKISSNIQQNEKKVREMLGQTPDLTIRHLTVGASKKKALLIGLEKMVDKDLIQRGILQPIMENQQLNIQNLKDLENVIETLNFSKANNFDEVIYYILDGNAIFFLDGEMGALVFNIRAVELRSIEASPNENTIRGSHEGFTEALAINLTMIRRRINYAKLRFEIVLIGNNTKTKVCIAYVEDKIDPEVLEEVRKRIKAIDTDAIFESGQIEQFIEDDPQSAFPTIGNTERPDRLSAKLLEGRVGILVDGSPMTLTVPYLFIEGFQTPEDYYSLPIYTSVIRFIRYLSFIFSINLPAFYIAIQNFQKEMLPTEMVITLTATRTGVPFPLIMELILMLAVFEILREAGIRMPRNVGQAVSIVGALVIGEAAVTAGIVGAPTIIIVAIVGITTFVVTTYTAATGLLRIFMILPASILGLFGLMLANLAVLVHLASLKSFGVPYLSPLAPLIVKDLRDVFWRRSIDKIDRAPQSILQTKQLDGVNSIAEEQATQGNKGKQSSGIFRRIKR